MDNRVTVTVGDPRHPFHVPPWALSWLDGLPKRVRRELQSPSTVLVENAADVAYAIIDSGAWRDAPVGGLTAPARRGGEPAGAGGGWT